MPELFRWLCLCSVIAMAGCQSTNRNTFSWLPFKSTPSDPDSYLNSPAPKAVIPAATLAASEKAAPETLGAISAARIDELVNSGIKAVQENRLDDAAREFNSVLELVPDNATAHHGMAMIADLQSRWSDAEFHYKQALRTRPRDAGLLNDLGYSYLLQKRFHEASRYLTQAVEQNPQHEKAHENLAMLSLRQGDRVAAEQRLQLVYPAHEIGQQIKRMEVQIQSMSGNAGTALASQAIDVKSDATFEEVKALADEQRRAAEAERLRRNIPPASVLATRSTTPDSPGNGYWQNPQTALNSPFSAQPLTALSPQSAGQTAPQDYYPQSSRGTTSEFSSTQPAPFGFNVPNAESPQLASPQFNNQMNAPLNSNPAFAAAPPTGTVETVQAGSNTVAHQAAAAFPGTQAGTRHAETGQSASTLGLVNNRQGVQPTGSVVAIHSTGQMQGGTNNGMPPGNSQFVSHAGGGAYDTNPNGGVRDTNSQQNSMAYSQVSHISAAPQVALNNAFQNSSLGSATQYPAAGQMLQGGQPVPNQPVPSQTAGTTFPLAGLNVGPGTLFPMDMTGDPQARFLANGTIGVPAGAAYPTNNSQQVPHAETSPYTHPTSTHGAMFPQAQSVMPAQQAAASATFSSAPSRFAQPQPGGQFSSNTMGLQNAGAAGQGAPVQQATVVAPNPLEAYERQLQQLDSEYNPSLQQFNRQTSQIQPVQAQY